MTEIHAHEVLHMMLEQNEGFSRESLLAAIIDRFGENARFHSCSASGMDARAVIDFLESRGKFIPLAGGFNTARGRICNH